MHHLITKDPKTFQRSILTFLLSPLEIGKSGIFPDVGKIDTEYHFLTDKKEVF